MSAMRASPEWDETRSGSVGEADSTRCRDSGRRPEPEWMPTGTLNKQIARARKEMGEARWRKLNEEFAR